MRELALFAGAGGGILGGRLLGWRTICAVELDAYARRVLLARQRDGQLERFPIWDDVRTFDGHPWRGAVDVISGGFPCQDISSAGNGAGLQGSKSGLWREMARVICEVGPRYVFVENSPMLTFRGLDVVLGDLASMGYDARWGVLGARHVGAPHRRDRIWIAARYADGDGQPVEPLDDEAPRMPGVGHAYRKGLEGQPGHDLPEARREGKAGPPPAAGLPHGEGAQWGSGGSWYEAQPSVGCVADGVANRVDRLRALGNGQVPAVAALAWKTLTQGWL